MCVETILEIVGKTQSLKGKGRKGIGGVSWFGSILSIRVCSFFSPLSRVGRDLYHPRK